MNLTIGKSVKCDGGVRFDTEDNVSQSIEFGHLYQG